MVSPEFIIAHENDDLAALVLQRDRWPDVDVALAAECIAARRKLRLKVPQWYADPALICPIALSAEQCSSTATAAHKAALAAVWNIRRSRPSARGKGPGNVPQGEPCPGIAPPQACECSIPPRIADLTGGLGVDCWQFSKVAAAVLYNEMNPLLFEAAKANLGRLGCDNVEFSNICISPDTLPGLLDSFQPDLIFIDPARRSEGRKVFLPEDCSPDVLGLQDIILERGCSLMIKLSPMADISLLLRKFHSVKELHVVEADGECKELLLLQDPGFDGECLVFAEIAEPDDGGQCEQFYYKLSEEKAASVTYISDIPAPGNLLFEPGPALMKSGAFNLLSARFGLPKLGPSAHLYLLASNLYNRLKSPKDSRSSNVKDRAADWCIKDLEGLGKWFEIQEVAPFNKAALRDFATRWPDAEVTARALPLSSDALREKLASFGSKHSSPNKTTGATSNPIHLFGAGTTIGRLLIACRRL